MANNGFGAKVKLSVDKTNKKQFNQDIKDYINLIRISEKFKITKKDIGRVVRETQAELNERPVILRVKKIDVSSAVSQVKKDLQAMLTSLSVSNGVNITGLKDFALSDGGDATNKKTKQSADKAIDSLNQARATTSAWKNDLESLKLMLNGVTKSIKQLTAANSGLSNSDIESLVSDLTRLQNEIDAVEASQNGETEAVRKNILALREQVSEKISVAEASKRAEEEFRKEAEEAERSAEVQYASLKQVATLREQITRFLDKNTKLHGTEYEGRLNAILADLNEEGRVPVDNLNKIRDSFAKIRVEAYNAGKTGKSFFDIIKTAYEKFGGWSIVTRSLVAVWRQFKDMVEYVHQIDDAMTELKKVTEETNLTYERFLETAAKRAVKNGATVFDTITATADYARLGYNIDDASTLADASTIYKNVGDGIKDISEASQAIIATMKGFKIEAEDVMRIVDVYNEVGNKFAISSEGVGESLRRSSAALSMAGNTLEQSAAMAAAINEVVQDPAVVGTSLKAMSMYLRAAKVEAEEAGIETDGMADSVSKLREDILRLTNQKVDIQIDENTFKSTYEIIQEIAHEWKNIKSDTDKSALIKMIGGGVRQTQSVTALIENFAQAEKALNVANEASGSAMAENEKYLNSISGKAAQLKATVESLSNTLINSGTVKTVLDIAKTLVGIVDGAQKLHVLVPGIIGAIAGKKIADRHNCGLPPWERICPLCAGGDTERAGIIDISKGVQRKPIITELYLVNFCSSTHLRHKTGKVLPTQPAAKLA